MSSFRPDPSSTSFPDRAKALPKGGPGGSSGTPLPTTVTSNAGNTTRRRGFGRGPRAPSSARSTTTNTTSARDANRPPDPIVFQQFFKSIGPRTYAAQVKTAGNGNPYLVLTEGKRDGATGDLRKTRLFVFSEDFDAFLALLKDTADWLRAHPVPDDIRRRREKFWAKHAETSKSMGSGTAATEGSAQSRSSRVALDQPCSRATGGKTPARPIPRARTGAGAVQLPPRQVRRGVTPAREAAPTVAVGPRNVVGRFAASHPPVIAAV